MSSYFENNFEDLIERQVEQFNQHAETSANFHKYLLEMLCNEHLVHDHDSQWLRKPPVGIRTVQPIRLKTGVGSALLQAGKAGKQMVRKVFPSSRRQQRAMANQACIIEGEFRVITDDLDPPEATNTINHNKNPKETEP